MAPRPNLRVRMFGKFAVAGSDREPVKLAGKKHQALFAYLCVNAGKELPREKLAALLWGDRFEEQARQSLRQAISKLRNALSDSEKVLFQADGDTLTLNADQIEVDVQEFERLSSETSVDDLELAAGFYDGAFLDGFSCKEAAFDDWARSERTRYAEIAAQVLEKLCAQQESAGQTARAIATAQKLVQLDPTLEQAHRDLMRLFATVGQRPQALKQYQLCADILRQELGVEPDAMTKQLYAEVSGSKSAFDGSGAVPTAIETPAAKEAGIPDAPSIAVLPFTILGGQSEETYFADGIAEDLITALSKVRSFFVIDRSSSFRFKGQNADIKEIASNLGVRYVLEGSVRRAEDRVRVSAQLVDAGSGNHVWADRLDGDLQDVFDVQDKIVASVVGALEPQILRAEYDRIRQKRPERFDAYDLTLCGLSHMNKLTPADTALALDYFHKAITADPGYARAYCLAAWCYRRQVQLKGMILKEEERSECLRLARSALQIDNTDPYVLWQVGMAVAMVEPDVDSGTSLIDRSLAENPNSNRAWLASATVRALSGDSVAAIQHAERAMQLSPLDTSMWVAFGVLAVAHTQLANYEDAVIWARRCVQLHPDHRLVHLALIVGLTQLDRKLEAENALNDFLGMEPDLTLSAIEKRFPLDEGAFLRSFIKALEKTGFPA